MAFGVSFLILMCSTALVTNSDMPEKDDLLGSVSPRVRIVVASI